MEAFVDEVGRDFYFATEAEVEVVATFYLVEVHPKLWFGHEYILSALPWARFTTKVEVAVERAPTFGKIDAPHASDLETVYVGFARKTNYARIDFVESRERPSLAEILRVTRVGSTKQPTVVERHSTVSTTIIFHVSR